jgi:hypothetical protein
MPIALSLLVRTWAALDAALTFFRSAPMEVEAARRFALACRHLHRVLRRAGIRSRYLTVGICGSGKTMLRLETTSLHQTEEVITLVLRPAVASFIARACLNILEVQAEESVSSLLEYEAEELHAACGYLTELCRQTNGELPNLRKRSSAFPLVWDESRRQFMLGEWMAYKVQQLYRRVGASVN